MDMVSVVSLKQVRVYIECDANTTMAQLLLDVLDVCALLNQEACEGMAAIVKPHMPKFRGI